MVRPTINPSRTNSTGVVIFLGIRALGLQASLGTLGVLATVALNLTLTAYSRRAYRRWKHPYPCQSQPESVY